MESEGDWQRGGMLEVMVKGRHDGAVMGGPREDSMRPGSCASRSHELFSVTPAECVQQAARNPFPVFQRRREGDGWAGRGDGG